METKDYSAGKEKQDIIEAWINLLIKAQQNNVSSTTFTPYGTF